MNSAKYCCIIKKTWFTFKNGYPVSYIYVVILLPQCIYFWGLHFLLLLILIFHSLGRHINTELSFLDRNNWFFFKLFLMNVTHDVKTENLHRLHLYLHRSLLYHPVWYSSIPLLPHYHKTMFLFFCFFFQNNIWSRALDFRLSDWCSVSMVGVQIPSRKEQKFDSSKI